MVFLTRAPIFLAPIFKERIWGGTDLKKHFSYNIPSEHTGECWAISAHPNGQNTVENGTYKDLTLGELWDKHPELFNYYKSDKFPLLTKIIDANKDLSVQVHPDDEYAKKHENGEYGKTECWYILDCKKDAEMVFGHTAQTKEEFRELAENGEWDKLLNRIKIKPGDFFFVPSGTIHALCEGTLVLETQQSSDTTYRVYDYDRVDQHGEKRELHLEKAFDVTTVPHRPYAITPKQIEQNGATLTTYVQHKYFTVNKVEITEPGTLVQDKDFMLVSVIDGVAELIVDDQVYSIKKGDHFILPHGAGEFKINGKVELIVAYP